MKRALVFAAVWMVVNGCQTNKVLRSDGAVRPSYISVGITYFPYDQSMVRLLSAPHPDYRGWPDNRMHRDLTRLSTCGIDTVYVYLKPDYFFNSDKISRIEKFIETADLLDGCPHIVFVIDGAKGDMQTDRDGASLAGTLAGLRLHERSVYTRTGRKPLIYLTNWPAPLPLHPGLSFALIAWSPLRADADRDLQYAAQDRQRDTVLIRAGLGPVDGAANGNWRIERKGGRALIKALRAAIRMEPAEVVISSWNNFDEGSYVEPDLEDGDVVYRALCNALRATSD